MKVRAKFVVHNVSNNEDGSAHVSMRAVTSGSEENKVFTDLTPSGDLCMHIAAGKSVKEFFIPAKEYYIDIIDATPEVEQPAVVEVEAPKAEESAAEVPVVSLVPVVDVKAETEAEVKVEAPEKDALPPADVAVSTENATGTAQS